MSRAHPFVMNSWMNLWVVLAVGLLVGAVAIAVVGGMVHLFQNSTAGILFTVGVGYLFLCLFLLLRVTALGAVAAINPLAAGAIWLAASIMARSGALWLAVALPPARADGASATAGRVPMQSYVVGAVFALVLLFVLAGPATSLVGLGAALLLALVVIAGWTALCQRMLGGQTGDLIGALVALVEIAVLAALVGFV